MRSSKLIPATPVLSVSPHLLFFLLLTLIVPLSLGFIARFEINEGVPVESHVGSLASHSHSGSGSLMYNKVPNPKDASRYFNVDKFSGRISVASDLDRETICPLPTHKPDDDCILRFSVACLRIVGGSVEAIADVMVTVRDVNDNGCTFVPTKEQTIRIRENADVETTRIRLHSPLDLDSARHGHSIRWDQVRLEDSLETFRLHMVPSIKGSNFRNPHSIANRQQDVQLFLGLLIPLDFEKTRQYSLFVVAGDNSHKCKLALHVKVEDADDNVPIFERAFYNVTIAENLPFDEKIITVKAHDADAGEFGKVFYSIDPYLTDPAAVEMFHVDKDSGSIFRKTQPNYHDSLQYQLTVKAGNSDQVTSVSPSVSYDDGQPSFMTKVCINLEDVNDHEPVITMFSPTGSKKLTLTENLPSGQDVAILSVEDKDTGANAFVECQLKSQSIPGALSLRSMTLDIESVDDPAKFTTGRKYKLFATRSFDREQNPQIDFTIECWDGGKPVMRTVQKETIHILDMNDCAPTFDNDTYHFRVYEDANLESVGSVRSSIQIGQIKARDDDIEHNEKLQYFFSPECPQSFLDVVQVDKNTGTIMSSGGLDREKCGFLSCKVIANDMGTPVLSSQADVEIEVLDINDNAPQFKHYEYNFQVVENSISGTLVGIVHAFDADLGANSKLQFSLEGMQTLPWSQKADIESLFSSVHLSREKMSSQHLNLLQIEAQSLEKRILRGSQLQSNYSYVEDGQSDYEVRIYTAAPIDRESLVPLPGIGIDSSFLNSSAETVVLRFMLRAQDSGSPRLVSRVPINIYIADVNDNVPAFIFPPMDAANVTEIRLSIRESAGFQFTKVFASDSDAAENASLVYRIRAGDPFSLFKLDPRSGELSVAKDYSGNDQYMGQYLLVLEVMDSGWPRYSSEAQLLVRVDDSEPLGHVELDIFGIPTRLSSRSGNGTVSRNMNIYIIAAIIIAFFVISSILLVAICLVVRRAKATEQTEMGCVRRYCGSGGNGSGSESLQNGSVFHETSIKNGYLKSVPLTLCQGKYSTGDPMEENLSKATISYLTPQPTNGSFTYEKAMGFHQTPFCSHGVTVTSGLLNKMPYATTSAGTGHTSPSRTELGVTIATTGPGGLIRYSCLPTKQTHTLGRYNYLGQKKMADDRLTGRRNSLTDQDSGNGDSLDVASCLLTFPPNMEAPAISTPCFQHFPNQHHHYHHHHLQPPPSPPPAVFAISTEPQLQLHQSHLASSSPLERVDFANTSDNPMTFTFV